MSRPPADPLWPAALSRGRALGVLPAPGETPAAYMARLDALERRDAAPGPRVARFG